MLDLPMLADTDGYKRISPTDIAQYIRLDQCDRYLRLTLHSRSKGDKFMRDSGVTPQSIPPLLTRSGEAFENHVEQVVAARFRVENLGEETNPRERQPDNERIIAETRALAPGGTVILFQSRLDVVVNGWRMRGDVDILRLHRDPTGQLQVLIVDMKSSTTAKVEHRLQVAFYHEMLVTLYRDNSMPHAHIAIGILYRGPSLSRVPEPDVVAAQERERCAAEDYFGVTDALLDIVTDPDAYRGAIQDLVTSSRSTAVRVVETPFDDVPYHLTYKCDGCLFNEFCMKRSAEIDDLSLVPHLTMQEKTTLRQTGVTTTRGLAALKMLPPRTSPTDRDYRDLQPNPDTEMVVRQLSAKPPVGEHLDELIHRARRYRVYKKDAIEALPFIPNKGYGSLPHTDVNHNPNLVRIYIDAQHDYLQDRIYMLGALVVACDGGVEHPHRRRSIVRVTDGPPRDVESEEVLFTRWIDELLRAIVDLAAPDGEGKARAPIHLIFFNSFDQRVLLDGLGRHTGAIFNATPLYDFVTQIAGFDSPIVTFLDQEIRSLKNYPMVCQSLQAVAALLRFDWNTPDPYRDIFRVRLFDARGKLDDIEEAETGESPWYTSRARFNSQIPLEYAYAAWGDLGDPSPHSRDEFASYRDATTGLLVGFQARRLEALEHITRDFKGNKQTQKSLFDLPELTSFTDKAGTFAQALDEFVTIERHVELADWKAARLAPPERRVLAGDTLIVRYIEDDQDVGRASSNRENARRAVLKAVQRERYREAHPDAKQIRLPKHEKATSDWSQEGLQFRLRIECSDLDCCLDEVIALTTLKAGDFVTINPRFTVDSRLAAVDQVPFTPTSKQMLYGTRARIDRIYPGPKRGGTGIVGYVELTMSGDRPGAARGFAFRSANDPWVANGIYTLDEDPNNWHGYHCSVVAQGLCAGAQNTLCDRLQASITTPVSWSSTAVEAQARFLAGLESLVDDDGTARYMFEPSKRTYIGAAGEAPILLVQGPPGTGKSFTTAFAVLARMQGALADGREYRVVVSCKTHAATNVLLDKLVGAQQLLRDAWAADPKAMRHYFDPRLLDLPLCRLDSRDDVGDGITPLYSKKEGYRSAYGELTNMRYCVVATAPGGVYSLMSAHNSKDLFGYPIVDCVVLDEASQMSLPEAIMAALPLKAGAQVIVVGDHRQMAPIVKHAWGLEPRRTFQEFRSYESLFERLLELSPRKIQFSESFRLHRDMAMFLRDEIYVKDGIDYHSHRDEEVKAFPQTDPFIAAVLSPACSMIVVVHDEAESQRRNDFERDLIAPVLKVLTDEETFNLKPRKGLGVVVPHRAQRTLLQDSVEALVERDAASMITLSAVDTVEKFQGDERQVIFVSATESDPQYILGASEFLLDPRRLTVALSRAEQKMVLVAGESVFKIISPDGETFDNSQLWKNLLRRTCTQLLWEGEREGHHAVVWGNRGSTIIGPVSYAKP